MSPEALVALADNQDAQAFHQLRRLMAVQLHPLQIHVAYVQLAQLRVGQVAMGDIGGAPVEGVKFTAGQIETFFVIGTGNGRMKL